MLLYNEQACQMPYSKLEPLLRQLEPGKKEVDKVVKKKKVLYKSILIEFIKKWSFEKTFVQIFFSKTGQKRSKKTKIAPFSSYRGQMATCQRSKTKQLQRPLYTTAFGRLGYNILYRYKCTGTIYRSYRYIFFVQV